MNRQPELFSIKGYDFGSGDRRNGIFATIVMRGIKGQPLETQELSRSQALRFMADLALAVLKLEINP